MTTSLLKSSFKDNEYYTALFDSYIEVIRQSGLLLDEDLEVLVNQYETDGFHKFPTYKPSLLLKSSLSSLVGSLFLAKRYNSNWVIVPPVLLTAVSTLLEVKNTQIKKKQRVVVENIVNVSKKINTLYSSIKKYMKTRAEIENKSQKDFFKSYNKHIEEFLKINYINEVKYFNRIMSDLDFFVKYSNNLLTDDYNSIKDFKPFQSDKPKFETIESCIDFVSQIQDVHVWLTSKTLSYIGILLFSINTAFTEKVLERLLNKILPNLFKFLNQHYDSTKKSFYSLRNSVLRLSECRSQSSKPQIPNKLQKTLLSAVDNISIISEKSSRIFEEIENSSQNCTPELESALVDLRNHTYAAYESLDLLCRLYGILSSQNVLSNKLKVTTKSTKETTNDDMITVNHDDDIQAKEENFELYIENDFVSQEEPKPYVDDSSAYLNLMLQELKQSLKKHERFIEAKKRRGSIEEEKTENFEEDIPKFNLKALETDTEIVEVSASTLSPLISTSPSTLNLPPLTPNIPPPPPPPPIPENIKTFDVNFLDNESDRRQGSKSMLDSIKTLSGQLNRIEEVFGESGNEEEDDDECL